jgi:hypothetical protein
MVEFGDVAIFHKRIGARRPEQMPRANKRHIAYIILCFLMISGAVFSPHASALAPPSQDVVILVDRSESASPYISSIIEILRRFVTAAEYNDSFTCYQFSNLPVLFAGGTIEREGDIARLKSQLGQLRPVNRYTNYAGALRTAFQDLENLHSDRPDSEKVLILITDGRRDERDTSSEMKAFSQLLQTYDYLEAGTDYFFYCFFIGERSEKDLESYLRSTGAYFVRWPEDTAWLDNLTLADVRITEASLFLGNMPDRPTNKRFTIAFHPRRPPAEVSLLELAIEADFGEKSLDRFFDVNPRRFLCQQRPWNEQFNVEVRGFDRGDYSGSFRLQPSDRQTMLLTPRVVDFTFSIVEPLQVRVPAPLEFGPTELRGDFRETRSFSITPSRDAFPGDVSVLTVTPDIMLPDGVELEYATTMQQREMTVSITISRSGTIDKDAVGEYQGTVRLGSRGDWAFTTDRIPLTVNVTRSRADYGKIYFYLMILFGSAVGVALILLATTKTRTALFDYLAHRDRPNGKLVVVKDPTRGLVKNINLDRLSENLGTKDVTVGVGTGFDVDLAHRSMLDKCYSFTGMRTPDGVHTIAQAIKGTDEVLVNNISRTGRVQLRHLDTVRLGALEFRYEEPRLLRQAVVYFLTGDVWEGWLLSWNSEAEGFSFLRRDILPERKESYIRYEEVKAVAFVRDFEGQLTRRLLTLKVPRAGHRMKIVFPDLEELTGYVLDWKEPDEKFYLFPDKMGDNVLFFLIQRQAAKELAVLEHDERGAERTRRELVNLLAMMKTEFARP